MKFHLWFLLVSCFVFFDYSNTLGISDNSPLYSHPFIYGNEDFETGSIITLACNLTREDPEKEIPKYTFSLMEDETCRKHVGLNLSKGITYSKDGLHLTFQLSKSFIGKKTFACVLKSNKKDPPPGCHTVYVGPKPGKPTVSCVSHGFRYLRCTITPSGEELKNSTGLILPRHKFSESYEIILGGKKVKCPESPNSKSGCRYYKKGILTYKLPDNIIPYFKVRVMLRNLFGESQVTKFFNMCKIEQPVTGNIQASDKKPTSVSLDWTVLDTLLPTDSKRAYFQNTINCTSENSQFNISTFKLNHFFDDLQPYTLYNCVILTRSFLETKDRKGKSSRCLGRWSEPKSISFRTNMSAPSVGPLVPRGMILKKQKVCQLYFFEIPEAKRNGIVNRYRLSLLPVSNNPKPMFTESLNPSFDCSEKIDSVTIAGKTRDGGWGPDSKLDFILLSDEHVDIELWKNGSSRYQTVAKFSKKLEVLDAFLAVCNCGKTCDSPNFNCMGMRQIRHPKPISVYRKSGGRASLVFNDEIFSLREEKIAVHLSFRRVGGQIAYAMSDWVSCAYDKNLNFTVKESQFPAIKKSDVNDDEVSFTFNRDELACSNTIIKPVYEIYTRVTCNGELFKNFATPKGSRKTLTVSVALKPYENCEVEVSLDNKTFIQRYRRAASSKLWLWIFIPILVILVLIVIPILLCLRWKDKLKSFCDALQENKTTKDMNVNEPMMSTLGQTTSRDYNGGYDSIEPANTTTLETDRDSNEEAFSEQGVNTASTRLLQTNSSGLSGYIEHENHVPT